MRIGIFTDTYHPATNGLVVFIDIIKKNLELLGHEVYIFAPETSTKMWRSKNKNIIRFPALKGVFYDEQLTSFFFPPIRLKKIKKINLDSILVITPAQIGLLGVYAAMSFNIPLYVQYGTDLVAYVKKYPGVIYGVLALIMSMPLVLKLKPVEAVKMTNFILKSRNAIDDLSWRQNVAKAALGVLFDRSDCVITFSKKIAKQLEVNTNASIEVLPIGADALMASQNDRNKWRNKWRVDDNDVVFIYVGRIAPEKNLELLVEAYQKTLKQVPNSKLVIVGGFFYQDELKKIVSHLALDDKVIFTGRIDRSKLGGLYAAADIFCFPSLTDTQALVLNEAALAKLPMIWCDEDLNDVLIDKLTGFKALPTKADFASKMIKLAVDSKLIKEYGLNAHKKALEFSELEQTKKLAELFSRYNRRKLNN